MGEDKIYQKVLKKCQICKRPTRKELMYKCCGQTLCSLCNTSVRAQKLFINGRCIAPYRLDKSYQRKYIQKYREKRNVSRILSREKKQELQDKWKAWIKGESQYDYLD